MLLLIEESYFMYFYYILKLGALEIGGQGIASYDILTCVSEKHFEYRMKITKAYNAGQGYTMLTTPSA